MRFTTPARYESTTQRVEVEWEGYVISRGVLKSALRGKLCHQGRKAAGWCKPRHGRGDRKRGRSISGLRAGFLANKPKKKPHVDLNGNGCACGGERGHCLE